MKTLREFFDELKRENGLEDTLNLLEMDGVVKDECESYDDNYENKS